MSQPATKPQWATSATLVTPSGAQQSAGFAAGQQPPAQFHNWLFYWIYQWILWLVGSIATYTRTQPACSGFYLGSGTAALDSSGNLTTSGGAATVAIPASVRIGERLLTVKAYLNRTSGAGTVTLNVVKVNLSSGAVTSLGSQTTTSTGYTSVTATLSSGGHILTAGERIEFSVALPGTGDSYLAADLSVDTP